MYPTIIHIGPPTSTEYMAPTLQLHVHQQTHKRQSITSQFHIFQWNIDYVYNSNDKKMGIDWLITMQGFKPNGMNGTNTIQFLKKWQT